MSTMSGMTPEEHARYEWQMWTPGIGVEGQEKLRSASVMVSRLGGVGGTVAYYLAAVGIGKLVLAHAGNVKPSDLNRQLLMTTDWLGKPRIESAKRRLNELNPHVEIVAVGENVSSVNAQELVDQADIVVDGAPLFDERYAMNAAAVAAGKPLVECAMYDFDAQLTTVIPGRTPCVACIYPEPPPNWKREFPVVGAVSGTIASLAAVEVVKLLTGIGEPLAGRVLHANMRNMTFRTLPVARNPECPVCRHVTEKA
ncbi:MAG: HesA/MoeB/ThiF family protein [Planctomycetaceae bacterium]|nr:HesA/MoeB/ThiF family protein [Planctomycetaceae bacterium]